MTTPDAPVVVGPYSITVCGTCNVVFMVHAGRPSCPSCGGDPFLVLYEGEIPTSSNEEDPATEGEAPAPAEGTSEAPAAGEAPGPSEGEGETSPAAESEEAGEGEGEGVSTENKGI